MERKDVVIRCRCWSVVGMKDGPRMQAAVAGLQFYSFAFERSQSLLLYYQGLLYQVVSDSSPTYKDIF